jgi:hypothetical protein
MIAHIAKRIGLVVMGYISALAASAILVWGFAFYVGYTSFQLWIRQMPERLPPEYEALIFILVMMLIYSFLPVLILVLVAETFRWRRLWIYLLGSVLVLAVVTLPMSFPASTGPMTSLDWIVLLATNLSALLGGFIYWAIAGRQAGWLSRSIAA